eukprot:5730711-Pyramimonas_sp.AAC.1
MVGAGGNSSEHADGAEEAQVHHDRALAVARAPAQGQGGEGVGAQRKGSRTALRHQALHRALPRHPPQLFRQLGTPPS